MPKSPAMVPDVPWTPAEIEAHRVMLIGSFVRLISDYENTPTDEHVRCIVDRMKRFPTICTAPEIGPWLVKHRALLTTSAGTSGTSQVR